MSCRVSELVASAVQVLPTPGTAQEARPAEPDLENQVSIATTWQRRVPIPHREICPTPKGS